MYTAPCNLRFTTLTPGPVDPRSLPNGPLWDDDLSLREALRRGEIEVEIATTATPIVGLDGTVTATEIRWDYTITPSPGRMPDNPRT